MRLYYGMAAGPPPYEQLRCEVSQYARNLRDVLSERMGIIALDDMPRSAYQNMELEPYNKHSLVNHGNDVARTKQEYRTTAKPLRISQDDILQEWRRERIAKPLIVIAPAGAGKSSLLESFAYHLANDLVTTSKTEDFLQPQVPMLISLHWLLEDRLALIDYLRLNAENKFFRIAIQSQLHVLSEEVITHLFRQNRLLPLIDGFDELPSSEADKLLPEIRRLKTFVLVSRPGYGAEKAFPSDPKRHRTLSELSGTQPKEFVETYFRHHVMEQSFKSGPQWFSEESSGPIGHLLTCPLYLKTWCDFLFMSVDHTPPRSMRDLSRQLLTNYIDRRKIFTGGFVTLHRDTKDYDDAVAALSNWVGRLGVFFANRGFAGQRLDGLEEDKLRSESISQAKPAYLIDIAVKIGLLIKVNQTYYLPKIPLVEYCIGKYLADDVVDPKKSPTLLIETFRRWIWRPNLHDILDYTFDSLWNADITSRLWADQLLKWAVAVGHRDRSGQSALIPQVQDDLTRPFAIAALRWHSVNTTIQHDQLAASHLAAEQVALALKFASSNGVDIGVLLNGHALFAPIIDSLVTEFIAQLKSEDADSARIAWLNVIHATAARVKGGDAVELVEQWITRWDADLDYYTTEAQSLAIVAAAGRVNEDSAPEIVEHWIALAKDDPRKMGWLTAAVAAAKRIRGDAAVGLVENWIARSNDEQDHALKWAWRQLAYAAVAKVKEGLAAQVVENWITNCNDDSDDWITWTWQEVGRLAATQIEEDFAAGFVKAWIVRYCDGRGISVKDAWRDVICSAVCQISENSIGGVIEQLISLHDSEQDYSAQRDWKNAISSAASQVNWDSPPLLVEDLITRCNAEHNDSAKELWRNAIELAARKMRGDSAAAIVEKLIAQHNAERDVSVKVIWRRIIGSTAEGLKGESASRFLRDWTIHHHAERNRSAKKAWLQAVNAVACLLKEEPIGHLEDWIIHYNAEHYGASKEAWRRAIRSAFSDSSRDISVTSYDRLINTDMRAVVFKSAAKTSSIAIIYKRQASNRKNFDIKYEAVLRDPIDEFGELILDRELVVAPELIRRALLGPFRPSFIQTKLLAALYEAEKESIAQKDDKYLWLSWRTLCERTDIRRGPDKDGEQKTPLIELLNHAMIEARDFGKVRRYRITTIGKAAAQIQ